MRDLEDSCARAMIPHHRCGGGIVNDDPSEIALPLVSTSGIGRTGCPRPNGARLVQSDSAKPRVHSP